MLGVRVAGSLFVCQNVKVLSSGPNGMISSADGYCSSSLDSFGRSLVRNFEVSGVEWSASLNGWIAWRRARIWLVLTRSLGKVILPSGKVMPVWLVIVSWSIMYRAWRDSILNFGGCC